MENEQKKMGSTIKAALIGAVAIIIAALIGHGPAQIKNIQQSENNAPTTQYQQSMENSPGGIQTQEIKLEYKKAVYSMKDPEIAMLSDGRYKTILTFDADKADNFPDKVCLTLTTKAKLTTRGFWFHNAGEDSPKIVSFDNYSGPHQCLDKPKNTFIAELYFDSDPKPIIYKLD
jgi:hypothetical protein